MRERRLAARRAEPVVIQTDASLWGGGAVFWHHFSFFAAHKNPDEFFPFTWGAGHVEVLGMEAGDVRGQAVFEAYTMLEAVALWVTAHTLGKVRLIGDAEGVLFGLTKLSAPSGKVNQIAKDIALVLAPLGQTLCGFHVWGENNEVADALSRVAQGAPFPVEVDGSSWRTVTAAEIDALRRRRLSQEHRGRSLAHFSHLGSS